MNQSIHKLISKIGIIVIIGFIFRANAQPVSNSSSQPTENSSVPGIINRYSLITRHNPSLHEADPSSPFTVGNGGFAFTADVTGLQTFPADYYAKGIPLETLSEWCWHSFPNTANYTLSDASREYIVHGQPVSFPTEQNTRAGKWLRANPHRLPLGRIGFELKKKNGLPVSIKDLANISQTLDLWAGILKSSFSVEGEMVYVETVCHPERDLVAMEVKSSLIQSGQIQVIVEFPYALDPAVKNKPDMEWNKPERHSTIVIERYPQSIDLKRVVDSTEYFVGIKWEEKCEFREKANHKYELVPLMRDSILQFSIFFSKELKKAFLPPIEETSRLSAVAWKHYWMKGGAVDFSGSTDPRAFELERRIILSQYLLRAQYCGITPPQESGLTHISWYGKHHTEMIWWHAAHFSLWNHPELLEKNLLWYVSNLPVARQTAKERGLDGARWSKMVGPDGRESPGNNPFIIWNQPHPVYLAELLYRSKSEKETLEKWQDIVLESAHCMASMVAWDLTKERYVLGPPLWHAQETYDPLTSQNPTFELAYWVFGLELAQRWLERLKLKRNETWDHIIRNVSSLPVKDGLYVGLESSPTTFTEPENEVDHPSMLMALGFLPGKIVDTAIMRRTLSRVVNTWRWQNKIWGWDYPMIAMTAARLGDPELAIEILLKAGPSNHYANNGHCAQTSDLPVYLPANGALLSAVALMTAGWDGAGIDTPGFPKNGKWKIIHENIQKLP